MSGQYNGYIINVRIICVYKKRLDESCNSIGALFGNSPRTVSNWIKRVNSTGDIESLRSKKPSGCPPRLSEEQRQELREILQESPEKHGITSNIWDGKRLSAFIEKRYGIALRTRAGQRLFHKLGFSLKRARPVVALSDETKKDESKKNFRIK